MCLVAGLNGILAYFGVERSTMMTAQGREARTKGGICNEA